MNGENLLFYIDSKIMSRHHGQTIRKNHLQHKKLVIKVINTKPNKKCKRLKIKSIKLDTCLHQVM
ncbi:hypothetical protein HanRHA438_Chr15g0717561 [Helianthus annuus]|nr:hypothetical protein HanRHA438_Chr15g0717561 [Helianthus annuus]